MHHICRVARDKKMRHRGFHALMKFFGGCCKRKKISVLVVYISYCSFLFSLPFFVTLTNLPAPCVNHAVVRATRSPFCLMNHVRHGDRRSLALPGHFTHVKVAFCKTGSSAGSMCSVMSSIRSGLPTRMQFSKVRSNLEFVIVVT